MNGERVDQMSELEMMRVRADLGMVFQEGALFDSLTVRENVGYKLYEEELPLARRRVNQRVEEVLGFVGLAEHIDKMPSELSGGQRRRVAIARAMAAKPRMLLYDEPTTGLDPITATTVDEEIVKLRDLEGVSSIVVTHQLRDAFYVATHAALRRRRPCASSRPTRTSPRRPSSSCSRTATSSSRARPASCSARLTRISGRFFRRRRLARPIEEPSCPEHVLSPGPS